MTPFIRRNRGFSAEEANQFKGMVENSAQTTGDEVCKVITGAKCESGTWLKFDESGFFAAKLKSKVPKYGKYLWIQNPKCYSENKDKPLKTCEIVVYKSE